MKCFWCCFVAEPYSGLASEITWKYRPEVYSHFSCPLRSPLMRIHKKLRPQFVDRPESLCCPCRRRRVKHMRMLIVLYRCRSFGNIVFHTRSQKFFGLVKTKKKGLRPTRCGAMELNVTARKNETMSLAKRKLTKSEQRPSALQQSDKKQRTF